YEILRTVGVAAALRKARARQGLESLVTLPPPSKTSEIGDVMGALGTPRRIVVLVPSRNRIDRDVVRQCRLDLLEPPHPRAPGSLETSGRFQDFDLVVGDA